MHYPELISIMLPLSFLFYGWYFCLVSMLYAKFVVSCNRNLEAPSKMVMENRSVYLKVLIKTFSFNAFDPDYLKLKTFDLFFSLPFALVLLVAQLILNGVMPLVMVLQQTLLIAYLVHYSRTIRRIPA